MRRTRRAAAPDAVSPETPAVEPMSEAADAAATETNSAGTPADPSPRSNAPAAGDDAAPPEKPKRAPRRRTPKADAAPPAAVAGSPASAEPAPIDAEPSAAAEASAAPATPDAVPAPRRRRRTPKGANAPAEDAAENQPPAAELTIPGLEEAAEKPGGEMPPADASPAPPAPDAPRETGQSGRRRSRRGRGGSSNAAKAADDPATALELEASTAETAVTQDGAAVEPLDTEQAETRRGGRRSRRRERTAAPLTTEEAIALAGLSDFVTPVTTTETSGEPQTKKGRSRRRRETPEAASSKPPVDAPAETEEASDEAGRRSRRRRGRRRRGESDEPIEIAESAELLVDGDAIRAAEVEEEEDEDFDLVPLAPVVHPVYVAPPLVPPLHAAQSAGRALRVDARIETVGASGHRRFNINGRPYSPFLFFINTETAIDGNVVESQIREAAANGIHLYSAVMYLPLKNAYGERPFGRIDSVLGQILAADPEAYVIPRLQLVPTNYWVRTHPDQLARYADGSEGDVSFASREFWADCLEAVTALVEHFADAGTPGSDRVIGFHIDRGEWFHDATAGYDYSEPNTTAFRSWLRSKYQFDYALRAAWYDGKVTFDTAAIPPWQGQQAVTKKSDTPLLNGPRDGRWVDYAKYSSEAVAEAITGVAAGIKALSAGKLLVAVSYGYSLEFSARNDSGHLSLSRLLDSPEIDIIAGPNSYVSRGAGNTGAFSAPLDSVALHGKLWVMEDDTKTFLADTETEDSYNPKITTGLETQATHERHFGAALVHRTGLAWMDLWGQGWLNDPSIWQALGGLSDLAKRWSETCANRYQAPGEPPEAPNNRIRSRGRQDTKLEQGVDPDGDPGDGEDFVADEGVVYEQPLDGDAGPRDIESDHSETPADPVSAPEAAPPADTADGSFEAPEDHTVEEAEAHAAADATGVTVVSDGSTADDVEQSAGEDIPETAASDPGAPRPDDSAPYEPTVSDDTQADADGVFDEPASDAADVSEDEPSDAPTGSGDAAAAEALDIPMDVAEAPDADPAGMNIAEVRPVGADETDETAGDEREPEPEPEKRSEVAMAFEEAIAETTALIEAGIPLPDSVDYDEVTFGEVSLDAPAPGVLLDDAEDELDPVQPEGWFGAAPDVIAFVDEASLYYLKNDPSGLGHSLIGRTREMLLKTGASVSFFLQSDVVRPDLPDAPLYLFLNALRITTDERRAIRERLQQRGKTLAWIYAPGILDENGPSTQDAGDVIGINLRHQPWNTRLGSQVVEQRHPITERLRSGKRLGQDEILNPSFAVDDPQAIILAEYVSTGAPSIAVREHAGGWRSAFFGEPALTVELLRGLFQYAGVSLYSAQDDVVHATADGVVLIHAGYTGQRVINLPFAATVYDTAENRIIAVDSRSFRTFLRTRTSRMFLFGTSEEIAGFTGLEIPREPARAPRPEQQPRETPAKAAEAAATDAEPTEPAEQPAAPRSIPGLEFADELEDEDDGADMPAPSDDDAPAAPRSRWQRRRAAARARREAERKAKGSVQGEQPPVDLTTLMPDLPPRRKPTAPADPGNSAE